MTDKQTDTLPTAGRLAGVDYGTVRIGIAVTDPSQLIASPFENYRRQGDEQDAAWFRNFVKEETIVGFVVGLPIHLSGDESEKSREARQFATWLANATKLPVVLSDERYTSVDAEAHLMAANLTKKRRKARLDMLAAQMILKSYLDRRISLPPSV